MKYIIRIIAGIICTLFCFQTHAQAILGLTTTSVSNSNPNLGDQLYIFATLKNYSLSDTFNNVIGFEVANKDSILTSTVTVGKPPYTNTVIKLAPQEEKSALFTVQLFNSIFVAGPDIIIVWPLVADPNIFISDSAEAPINIKDPLFIHEKNVEYLHHYVANRQLFLENNSVEIMPERVQIFNSFGQQVLQQTMNNKHTIISLENFSAGIYLGYITFRDNKRQVIKIVCK